jgi:hypothetical protein
VAERKQKCRDSRKRNGVVFCDDDFHGKGAAEYRPISAALNPQIKKARGIWCRALFFELR